MGSTSRRCVFDAGQVRGTGPSGPTLSGLSTRFRSMFDSENVILNHSVNYNKKNDSLCGDGNLEDYPLSVGRVYSESRATTTTTTTTTSSSPRHLRPCGSVRIHIYQVRVHVPTRRVTLGFLRISSSSCDHSHRTIIVR